MTVAIKESSVQRERTGTTRVGLGIAAATTAAVFLALAPMASGITKGVCEIGDPRCDAPKPNQTQAAAPRSSGYAHTVETDATGREVAVCTPIYGGEMDPGQIAENKGEKKGPEKGKLPKVAPMFAILLSKRDTDVLLEQSQPNPHPSEGPNGKGSGNGDDQIRTGPAISKVKAPE